MDVKKGDVVRCNGLCENAVILRKPENQYEKDFPQVLCKYYRIWDYCGDSFSEGDFLPLLESPGMKNKDFNFTPSDLPKCNGGLKWLNNPKCTGCNFKKVCKYLGMI